MASLDIGPSVAENALFERLAALPENHRSLVAIAGPPGAGKSALADRLTVRLNRQAENRAATLPVEGFLLDEVILGLKGRQHRKGAPDTFDGGGLSHLIRRLKSNLEEEIAAPVYDRNLDLTRAGARLIRRATDLVLIEGNYLLSDTLPWAPLYGLFDFTVMVTADEKTLRRRLETVLPQYGLSADETSDKIERIDMPNARFVQSSAMAPDFTLSLEG
ncbi:MAG: hypothetical protein AAGM21_13195 [Pseudomonadota bacterium]